MKKLFLAIGFLFLCGYVMAQAKDGTAELNQNLSFQRAALIYLPYSPEVVEKALFDYLSKSTKSGQENSHGYSLSGNTLLVKSAEGKADMYFLIGLKEQGNKNESAVYLKLNSFFQNGNNLGVTEVYFDMQDAKDYLDNLAVAIKPYAKGEQLKLQQNNLADAQKESTSLVNEGNRLEKKREKLSIKVDDNENYKRDKGLARRTAKNAREIDENLTAQISLNKDIGKQIAGLALLIK